MPALARRVIRPVDAAGLVLVRQSRRGNLEILLGRRNSKSGFLPNVFVVPGGRVEPVDLAPCGFSEDLDPAVARLLAKGAGRRPPLAFARCALRETLEETGLLIGRLGRPAEASLNAAWKPYREQGVMPGFEALRFIFRAITPVYMPRRFNTRFFLADGGLAAGELKGDGELTDLRWQPRSKLGDLDLVDVTQELLKEAIRLWPIDRGDCEFSPKLLTYKNNMTLIRPLQ